MGVLFITAVLMALANELVTGNQCRAYSDSELFTILIYFILYN